MKNLVIVESPSKTKKLASFLGKDYKVLSSVGHVRDLPKSGLAIDVEHDFEPEYVISDDKKKVVRELKKEAKQADTIYLATDPDREGEAIAWHVGYLINGNSDLKDDKNGLVANKIKNQSKENPKVYRVTFNSITKPAVLEGFENPRKIDMNLVGAQQGRRVLDRLVGYKLSPLLWEKIRYGLSAGRVQSVAVRLVVERENEIENFNKEKYFEILGEFKPNSTKKDKIEAKLKKIDDKNIYIKQKFELFAGDYTATKTTIDSQKDAEKIVKDLNADTFTVTTVKQKETKKHPSPPFTTATMQQAASTMLGFAPKRTMQLAQKLYEAGYITYMRTDSVNIVPAFNKKIRSHVKKEYGANYLCKTERYFRGKKNVKTQEAHEAIHPTDLTKNPSELPKSVAPQQRKLYDLIYNRTVATQMAPAVYANTTLEIENKAENSPKYTFEAKGSVLKFDGYLRAYRGHKQDKELPEVKENMPVDLDKVEFTEKEMSPPPRYNESSLIRELEKFGIGRPSTYATIISTIQTRGYVKKTENKTLYPTDTGIVVNNLLAKHFPQIVDVDFTAKMEDDLDKVALGEEDWKTLIREFYGPFDKLLEQKKKEINKEDIVVLEKTDEVCPECGKGHLIVKLGKYGKFLSCDRYPDCKFAKPIENDSEAVKEAMADGLSEEEAKEKVKQQEDKENEELSELTKDPCPLCGGKLVIKSGRFGKFIACENYPKCKYTKSVQQKLNMKCPECGKTHGGEVVVKRTKKGRVFYGCSRYPDCKWASWKRPG